ncbi:MULTISPECIES: hypothetical protein [Kribbella]|uniref:hypothetical protein n=1 Tax=Kribbella TaxID=182639 RepID=UPI002F7C67F7
MSSQRVVSFELSEAQRAQVRRVVAVNQGIRGGRIERARRRMLAQLDRLTDLAPVETLPSREAVDLAFKGTDDVERPSPELVVLEQQLSRARARATTDDRMVEALLTRLPAGEPAPPAVEAALTELRSATAGQRSAALEALKEAVQAAKDRRRTLLELEHAAAIADALNAPGNDLRPDLHARVRRLESDVSVAIERHEGGYDVDSGQLVFAAARLRTEFAQDENDAHTLTVLAGLWRGLGYQVDVGEDRLIAHAHHDRGIAVRLVNGAAVAEQVGITDERGRRCPAPGSYDAVCVAAAEVERQAGEVGIEATRVRIVDEETLPLSTVAVRTARRPGENQLQQTFGEG